MNRSEEDLVPNWTENTKQGTNVRRGGSSLSKKYGSFTGCYSHKKRNLLILRNKNFFHLFFLNNPACFSTGTLTFKGKTFDEKLCCPFPQANCCEHNKCCRQQYKVCCPPPPAVPTYCCPADYPVCKDGQCYRARDGHMVSGEPAVGGSPLE